MLLSTKIDRIVLPNIDDFLVIMTFSDKIGIHINSLNKKENLSLSDKILFVKWLGNNEEFSIEKRINKFLQILNYLLLLIFRLQPYSLRLLFPSC